MRFTTDRRTPQEQAKSGLKIVAAMVSTVVVGITFATAYIDILGKNGPDHVLRGWMLGATTGAVVLATIEYWRRWFFYIPGYVAARSSLGLLLGWASPVGYIFVAFPVLLFAMAVLSFRFSRPAKLGIADRIALALSLLLMSCAVGAFLSSQPQPMSLAFAGAADILLLLTRTPSALHSPRQAKGTSAVGPNH
jgi:hypothetical protein